MGKIKYVASGSTGVGVGTVIFVALAVIQCLALAGIGTFKTFPGPWGGWLFVIGVPIIATVGVSLAILLFVAVVLVAFGGIAAIVEKLQ